MRVAHKNINQIGRLAELVRQMPPEQRRLFFALLQLQEDGDAPRPAKFFSFTPAASLDLPKAKRDYRFSLRQTEGHGLLKDLSDEEFDQLAAQL
jgi:hypothetical protein